jgi:hypothetical protein
MPTVLCLYPADILAFTNCIWAAFGVMITKIGCYKGKGWSFVERIISHHLWEHRIDAHLH